MHDFFALYSYFLALISLKYTYIILYHKSLKIFKQTLFNKTDQKLDAFALVLPLERSEWELIPFLLLDPLSLPLPRPMMRPGWKKIAGERFFFYICPVATH
jgi:hypothetical protein